MLAPTKEKVLERYKELEGKVENKDGALRHASDYSFYNISPYDFENSLPPRQVSVRTFAHISTVFQKTCEMS